MCSTSMNKQIRNQYSNRDITIFTGIGTNKIVNAILASISAVAEIRKHHSLMQGTCTQQNTEQTKKKGRKNYTLASAFVLFSCTHIDSVFLLRSRSTVSHSYNVSGTSVFPSLCQYFIIFPQRTKRAKRKTPLAR